MRIPSSALVLAAAPGVLSSREPGFSTGLLTPTCGDVLTHVSTFTGPKAGSYFLLTCDKALHQDVHQNLTSCGATNVHAFNVSLPIGVPDENAGLLLTPPVYSGRGVNKTNYRAYLSGPPSADAAPFAQCVRQITGNAIAARLGAEVGAGESQSHGDDVFLFVILGVFLVIAAAAGGHDESTVAASGGHNESERR